MKHTGFEHIAISGTGRLASGIVTNLLRTGAALSVLSENEFEDKASVDLMLADWQLHTNCPVDGSQLRYIKSVAEITEAELAIIIIPEELHAKQHLIAQLEKQLSAQTIIAVNTESFLLQQLQAHATHPERLIGLNWCDPAYTTAFLEIIGNEQTEPALLSKMELWAEVELGKDPSVVRCGYSVNARLMAALAREAFYLVENGYASVADIDRACRNDAGYYLPFSGNCRYMDLMGTYAYGLVMKDLNRELSKAEEPPAFFKELVEAGALGMEHHQGFYPYENEAGKQWEERFRRFSFEIKEVMDKYPFEYLKDTSKKLSSKITIHE